MAQITMYPAFVNSVETTITNSISDTDTIIYVLADTAIPSAPNLLVLGTGASAETVLMTDKTGNMLTVTRGVQGSAKAWPNGTVIARNYTAYDHDTFKANIEDNATQLAQIMPETGTFTPTIKGSTTAGTHTYLQQQGKYTKIGNQVFFSINIVLTTKDGTMAGGVQIGGLPFAQNNVPYESVNIGSINVNMSDTARTISGIIVGSNISLYEFFDNANTIALPSTAILATTQIRCSGVYEIA